ncbi:MAG: hypothetical protein ACYDEX_23600 [Mobilitalea sp.]
MLYTIDDVKVLKVPHKEEYKIWKSRLSEREVNDIKDEIRNRIVGKEVNVSSWIPGSNWTGTPFQVIYQKACKENFEIAGMCFGLFVWETLMENDEKWYFIKKKTNEEDQIEKMVYFRK